MLVPVPLLVIHNLHALTANYDQFRKLIEYVWNWTARIETISSRLHMTL